MQHRAPPLPQNTGNSVWVHGTRYSAASFEPTEGLTRALESNHTGLKYCFHFDEQHGVCRSGSTCVHAHRRPWALFRAANAAASLPPGASTDVVLEQTLDAEEARAVFVDDSWCTVVTKEAKPGKGKRAGNPQQSYKCKVHPCVAMVEHVCRQQALSTFKVLEMGGGPFAFLKQHEFALPGAIKVQVRCGESAQAFSATGFTVDERGMLLVHRPTSSSKRYTLRLAGTSCTVRVVSTGYEVSTRHAPTLTVVEGTSESRCTALDHFDHPLSPLIGNTTDLSSDRSSHTWSVSFSVPTSIPWAPVLLGAPVHCDTMDTGATATSADDIRSVVVTPTTHRHNDPDARREFKIQQPNENRCHFYRALGRDAFVEVCMREEDGSDLFKSPPEIVKRWTNVLSRPLHVNGAVYGFLTLGSNPRLAYFADITKIDACVGALGVDLKGFMSLPVHTRLKRLRLGFSETFSVDPIADHSYSVSVVPDVKATDGTDLTDGSGVMSAAIKSHIQSFLDQQCAAIAQNSDCSGVQFRMGAFKGTLVAARGALAGGKDFEIFKSCEKVACSIDASTPLNIVATSKWSAGARLDKYVMTVLVNGGLTLNALMELGLKTYADRAAALNVARRPELSRREKIDLWQQEVVEDTKKHVQINGVMGATLMGFIDPSGELQATAADPTDGSTTLPCVFVAPPSQPAHEAAYAELSKTGKAVITRSPTYALGDVRVVRVLTAADMPSLDHLRDVLVFPRKGPTSLPALMSGGDLDGDEFKLVWDPRVLGSFRTIDESTPPALLQGAAREGAANNADHPAASTMRDAAFAARCLNERVLLGKLVHAQLGWLLADPHGAEAKRCAALCGQEVDGRAAGKFIVSHSVKDLTQPPPFIATAGVLTRDVRQVNHFLDAYVSAPRLSIEHWWPAIATVTQVGITPNPEDEFLAAVCFPAQQGLGRLARLQWSPSVGIHQRRIQYMPTRHLLGFLGTTPIDVIQLSRVDQAIARVKRRHGACYLIAFRPPPHLSEGCLRELGRRLTLSATDLTSAGVLHNVFPGCRDEALIQVNVKVTAGRTFLSLNSTAVITGSDIVGTLRYGGQGYSMIDDHREHDTPIAPRCHFAPGFESASDATSLPKPVFSGIRGMPMNAHCATDARDECTAIVSQVAEALAQRFGAHTSDVEEATRFYAVLRPHLPYATDQATTPGWSWAVDVCDSEAVPVTMASLAEQRIKFGPMFFTRGKGHRIAAETMRFEIQAIGSGLVSVSDVLAEPIAHLRMDDTPHAFPVKVVGADHPAVEIVVVRLSGKASLFVEEPTTRKRVLLQVEVRATFDPLCGRDVKPVWELEPSVIVDARDPGMIEAVLASTNTLLDAKHYMQLL